MSDLDLDKLKRLNQSLIGDLEQKDKQIQELKKTLDELLEDGADAKDKKLMDMAKKNRAITVKLNKEQGTNAQLQQQITELKKQIQQSSSQDNGKKQPKRGSSAGAAAVRHYVSAQKQAADGSVNESVLTDDSAQQNDAPDQSAEDDIDFIVREYKAKHEKVQIRVKQLKEELVKFKSDATKMRALLAKEIGENVNIDEYMQNPEGFRGRAQQIIMLKNKLKSLQQKLAAPASPTEAEQLPEPTMVSSRSGASYAESAAGGSVASAGSNLVSARPDIDDKNQALIERIDREKRNDMISLQKELAAQHDAIKKLKMTVDSVNARNRNLEQLNADAKSKVQRLFAKAENDDKLINALKAELEQTKRQARDSMRASGPAPLQLPPSTASSQASAPLLSSRTTGSEEGVFFYSQQARAAEEKLKQAQKTCDLQAQELLKKDEIIRNLRNDVQRASVNAIDQIRASAANADNIFDKYAGSEKELKLRLNVAEIEIEKLRELRQMLETKVRDAETAVRDLSTKYNKERQRAVELELKVEKQQPPSTKKLGSNIREAMVLGDMEQSPTSVRELREQLDLARDELHALKETLRVTTQSKNEEAKIYLDMIEKQKAQFTLYINELKEKLTKAGVPIPSIPSQSSMAAADNERSSSSRELTQRDEEINQLRAELDEIRMRYNAMATQLQNAKNSSDRPRTGTSTSAASGQQSAVPSRPMSSGSSRQFSAPAQGSYPSSRQEERSQAFEEQPVERKVTFSPHQTEVHIETAPGEDFDIHQYEDADHGDDDTNNYIEEQQAAEDMAAVEQRTGSAGLDDSLDGEQVESHANEADVSMGSQESPRDPSFSIK